MSFKIFSFTMKAACLAHVSLTTISLAHGIQNTGQSPISEKDNNELTLPMTYDLQKIISQMYSGQGVALSQFNPNAVFEDPAAKCVGVAEIGEAFRALRVCSPQSLSPPFIVGNATTLDTQEGIGCMVVLKLHQRYFGWLTMESLVLVEAGEDGLITRVEERWNGTPLITMTPFSFVRRANGLISYAVTSLFI